MRGWLFWLLIGAGVIVLGAVAFALTRSKSQGKLASPADFADEERDLEPMSPEEEEIEREERIRDLRPADDPPPRAPAPGHKVGGLPPVPTAPPAPYDGPPVPRMAPPPGEAEPPGVAGAEPEEDEVLWEVEDERRRQNAEDERRRQENAEDDRRWRAKRDSERKRQFYEAMRKGDHDTAWRNMGVPPEDTGSVSPLELDPREYRVWFGTDRAPNHPADLSKGFSARHDEVTHYGHCDVLVPESHKVGSTGSGWLKRFFTGIDDRLKLNRIARLAETDFWRAVREQLKTQPIRERDAVVFIHGYNVSFEAAAIGAAQIGYDLSIKGAMAFFSWPSRGETDHYPSDEATIEASEKAIADFLCGFAAESGANKIHVIAHSMGNRGLLRAFNRIVAEAGRRRGAPFGELILAAPDVDARTFAMLAGAYEKASIGTTLYISAKDKALGLSRWLHDHDRVGFEPPVAIFPPIETISVSQIDLDLLGHGYIAEARPVLEDMRELLAYGTRAAGRTSRLDERKDEKGRTYWAVKG